MEITESYRKARRNTSIICSICIAWSAAQFDIKLLDVGFVGKVDISGASIPFIFACAIIYLMIRCTLEFMMQPTKVRRWNLAQIDYKITLYLVRISLLTIATAIATRSLGYVAGVIIAAIALFFGFILLVTVSTIIIMPLRMYFRKRKGKISGASSAIEAVTWSMIIVALLYTTFFASICFTSNASLPYLSYLPNFPNKLSTVILSIAAIIIAVSFFFESNFLAKIFAIEPIYIIEESKLPNGSIGITIKENPNHPGCATSSSTPQMNMSGQPYPSDNTEESS